MLIQLQEFYCLRSSCRSHVDTGHGFLLSPVQVVRMRSNSVGINRKKDQTFCRVFSFSPRENNFETIENVNKLREIIDQTC